MIFTPGSGGELKKLNPKIEVLGEAWSKFGTTDFGPYVTTIMAAKPQAVFSSLWGGDWVNWLKAAVSRGYYKDLVEVAAERRARVSEELYGGNLLLQPSYWWMMNILFLLRQHAYLIVRFQNNRIRKAMKIPSLGLDGEAFENLRIRHDTR